MKQILKYFLLASYLFVIGDLSGQNIFVDSLFGSNGFGFFQTERTPYPSNFYNLENGKLLVCGLEYSYLGPPIPPPSATFSHVVVRYNECGQIDSTYGVNGRFTVDEPELEGLTYPKSFILRADQSVLMAGYGYKFYNSNYTFGPLLNKITPEGFSDPNFIVQDLTNYFDSISSVYETNAKFTLIEEDEDGKIFCVGSYLENGELGILLAKFNSDGSFDNSYFNNGILREPLQDNSIEIISSHRIAENQLLFVGQNEMGMTTTFVTNDEGEIDTSYGVNGFRVDNFIHSADNNIVQSAVVNEKLYLYSRGFNDENPEIRIKRLLLDGSPDLSFGIDGIARVTTSLNGGNTIDLNPIDFLADERILIGYRQTFPFVSGNTLMLKENGQIDSSFAENGKLQTHIVDESFAFNKSIILDNERWLFVGSATFPSRLVISRYTSNSLVPEITIEENQLNSGVESESVSYAWYYNGEILEGENHSSLSFDQNGEYSVIVTEIENCGSYSDTIEVNILNSVYRKKGEVVISPNPTANTFSVKGDYSNEVFNILDMSGKTVHSGILSSQNQLVDITELSTGVYILRLKSGYHTKLVKY
ncbi:MAG: T9SS type A sorting domain-containing protein [Aequorivita sp.]|nr:T9SS type A sorting domain-containing protein [Aequorivita sp.]